MPRGWMTIRVTLLGGGGIECDPAPGRTMLVGPRHTFADLAKGIDAAFGRWDLSHLHMFELANGRQISSPDPDWDVADEGALKVSAELGGGDRFVYVFDLGDNWTHACEVEDMDVDPVEVSGILPSEPVPIWGWGSIPDQYGRRWPDDTGEDNLEPGLPDSVPLKEWLRGAPGRPDRRP